MCAGPKVTYRIQINNMLLPGFCSSRGNVPVNITVAPDIVNQLGNGCHHLVIYASNVIKAPDVFTHLQVSVTQSQPMSYFREAKYCSNSPFVKPFM